MIAIIYLSTQVNARLQRKIDPMYYKGEHGLCLIFALVCGFIAQIFLSDDEVKDLLYSQAIIFKLGIVPMLFYDQAYNVKHYRPGNFSNCALAALN